MSDGRPTHASSDSEDERLVRVEEILFAHVQRRNQGEVVSDDDLLRTHPELMPELKQQLELLSEMTESSQASNSPNIAPTVASKPGSLNIRCPHCRQTVSVSSDATVDDITCSSCGSRFSLEVPATEGFGTSRRLGHFELIEEVGTGAFGSVWKACDRQLDRTVAVKIPRQGRLDADELEQFVREARAAAQLNHPHIVTVHEVGREEDTVYIVSDFVDGVALSDWLTGQKPTFREAAQLCEKVATALEHAHQAGVIHRDLKPQNIMLDGGGEPHLMDFGLARRDVGDITMTVDGRVLGTPAYMSPEQARGEAHQADRRTDVYSLGVILFELLTGELPFRGNARMLIHQVLHEDAPSPRTLNSNVPKDLETICLKCLEKKPQQRFDSAKDVADELGRYLADQPIHARPITQVERGWRWCKRNRAVSGLVAAVIVVAVTFAIAVYGRLRELQLSVSLQQAQESLDRQQWARESAIPDVRRWIDGGHLVRAFRLAGEARQVLPDDPTLSELWQQLVTTVTIDSKPSGASVLIQDWHAVDDHWLELGRTPLSEVQVPQDLRDDDKGVFRWRLMKNGYLTREFNDSAANLNQNGPVLMPEEVSAPQGMVYMPADNSGQDVGAFWVDRYEVTNRQFQQFVHAGGYENPECWKHEFVRDAKTIPWNEAMVEFRDGTGKPGPATWTNGRYPDGEDDYPVQGLSWYEAAAYAQFVNKSLPTIHHWAWAANWHGVQYIVPLSNFSGQGPAPVGSHKGIGRFDVYDMFGNVNEWCWNATDGNQRCFRGGAWDEPDYGFHGARSPFSRLPTVGFRCVRYLDEPSTHAMNPTPTTSRDYAAETRASPQEFQSYLRQYAYDRAPLNASIGDESVTKDYRHQPVRIDAAYREERFDIHLFLPRDVRPPYEPIVVFPGAGALRQERFVVPPSIGSTPYVMKFIEMGRAVCWPVYQGTFERSQGTNVLGPEARIRDLYFDIAKDLSRSVDYLETRDDLDVRCLVYCGLSWGAAMGPVMVVAEPRIKAAVLLSGGYVTFDQPNMPEVEPFQFAPHVQIPVLMISGRYDTVFPLDSSQRPLFDDLGSTDKHHVWNFNTGHSLPVDEAVGLANQWLREKLRQ